MILTCVHLKLLPDKDRAHVYALKNTLSMARDHDFAERLKRAIAGATTLAAWWASPSSCRSFQTKCELSGEKCIIQTKADLAKHQPIIDPIAPNDFLILPILLLESEKIRNCPQRKIGDPENALPDTWVVMHLE